MSRISMPVAGLTLGLGLLVACEEGALTSLEPAQQASELAAKKPGKKASLDLCSPATADFSLASTNPYFPLQVGQQWVYAGEEDGEELELVITVLDETEVVAGVTTHVLEERESVDGELLEVSRNFYVEASDGTVCYFGEEVDVFEDGQVTHPGAWRADEPGNLPGIIMPADPRPGMKYQNEFAPGIAEDEAKIVGIGPVTVPADTFTETIRVREFNPLDGDKGFKVYAADVGLIIDGPVELVSF